MDQYVMDLSCELNTNIYVCLDSHKIKGDTCLSTQVFFLLTVQRRCFFLRIHLQFISHLCHCYVVFSIHCSLVITSRKRADLLTLWCIVFSCVFVTFPYGAPGRCDTCLYRSLIFVFLFTFIGSWGPQCFQTK